MKKIINLLIVYVALSPFLSMGQTGHTSKGKEFWIMFTLNYTNSEANTLRLFVTSESNTTGIVEIPAIAFSQPFTVTPGTTTTITVPWNAEAITSDIIENKGIHVTSEQEITVYGLNRISASTDAFLALPLPVLGKEHIILSYTTRYISWGSCLGIVGTVDGTNVTITPSATSAPGRHKGVPFTITLNKGQTYQLLNRVFEEDLTGTIISSDQPIAVFGGNGITTVPVNASAADHLVEQLPPINAWGKRFVTVPLATRLKGDTFRFLASTDNTELKINGVVIGTLNRGKFHEMILTNSSEIVASHPILVCQYSNSTSFDGVVSDPFMMLIPPFEQFLSSYTVSTPVSGFSKNFINIVASKAGIGNIRLDGNLLDVTNFTAIGTTGFSGAQLSVGLGTHTLSSAFPFGAFIYGFDNADSYGYAGGQSVSSVALVSNIFLDPKVDSKPKGSEHCLTAKITDQNNNPVPGIRVDFSVTDANPISGFVNTESNGIATFCFTGAISGTDQITASVGSLSDNASITFIDDCPQNLSISDLPPSVCQDASAITLTGSPEGGTFSGPGISGNQFNPSLAGIGNKIITYEVTQNGCTKSTNKPITVIDPQPDISNLPPSVCQKSPSITLTATPAGGTFSGPGVSGNQFNPSVAGLGDKTITYEVTQNGCTRSIDKNISVIDCCPADPGITGLPAALCVKSTVITLTGSPAGGTFSGAGISGNLFNPSVAGEGLRTITYSVTANGCTKQTTQNVNIVAYVSTPSITGNSPYCVDAPVTLTASSSEDATYHWTGPHGFSFVGNSISFPQIALADEGIYKVYAELNGCRSVTATANVSVMKMLTATETHNNVSSVGAEDGSITVKVVHGESPYLFKLNDGAYTLNNKFTKLPEGTYSITIKYGNECTYTINGIELTHLGCTSME